MTHADLVTVAAKWLRTRKRCSVVVTELVSSTAEQPDALGYREQLPMLVECKTGDTAPAPALRRFARELGTKHNLQLVEQEGHDRVYAEHGVRVLSYQRFLAGLV